MTYVDDFWNLAHLCVLALPVVRIPEKKLKYSLPVVDSSTNDRKGYKDEIKIFIIGIGFEYYR